MQPTRKATLGSLLALGLALIPAGASADDWSDCVPFGPGPKTEQACTAVITGATRSPQDLANAYARRGAFYRSRQMFEQAHADFDAALKLDPDSWEVYYERGLAYRVQQRLDEAQSAVDRAIAIDPKRQQAIV